MIYDYYCTNCGHKLHGEQIVFDLAQMLDLCADHKGTSIFIEFTPGDLIEQAEKQNMRSQERMRLKITLKDLLFYMSRNFKKEIDRKAMQELKYDQFLGGEAIAALLSNSRQTDEVVVENSRFLVDAIKARLSFDEAPKETENLEGWENDTSHYFIFCWVEPIYFPGTKEIYTLHFSCEEHPVNLKTFENISEIRGYCPECKKPVISGSGMYEHFLVGFLGAQSAGKTSLFVAMINELPNIFLDLGIKLPSPLYLSDGKIERLREAIMLHKNGWAVKKTDAYNAETGSFNASLLIESDYKKVLLSFIDISGELCYDKKNATVNQEAFRRFPLITACHLYMICTCVSQKGYGENDGKTLIIPNTALLQIAEDIYKRLKNPKDIPPMCLLITKVDMARLPSGGDGKKLEGKNPFDNNKIPKIPRNISTKKEKHPFEPYGQLAILRTLYEDTGDKDIRDALEWCCKAFINNCEKTYISLLSCSALGKEGKPFDPEKDDLENGGDEFESSRLDDVWCWILCNLGVIPVNNGYCFPYIPSYGEAYRIQQNDNNDHVRVCYEMSGEKDRTEGVYQLYLNPSKLDKSLRQIDRDDQSLWERIRSIFKEPREEIVKQYLMSR